MRPPPESFPGREFYKGKGVDWNRFLMWLVPVFAVATLLAVGMALLFRAGHYYILIVPFLAAAAVGGMLHVAVNKGHCRNAIVAGAAGVIAGFLLYIGHFYFGMIHDAGSEIAGHPEILPAYIRYRMKTEVTQDAHGSRHDDEYKPPGTFGVYLNWGVFVFEFVFVMGIVAAAGMKRAKKPYCPACHRWTVRELTHFEPAQSAPLLDALRAHSTRSLAALSAQAPFNTIPNVSLAADFCPSLTDGRTRDCPVYVSIKDINTAPKAVVRDTFEQAKGKALARNLQLYPDELAALAPRFKAFETVTGRSAVAALLPEEEPADDAAPEKNLTYAEILPLTQDHAGKIMTRKTVLIGSALSLITMAGVLGGALIMLWGLLMAFPDHPPLEGVSQKDKMTGIVLLSVGGLWFLVSLGMALTDPGRFSARYLKNLFQREFARRTSVLVEPNDPDAVFMEVVPKMNWGKMMLENASDVGYLVVDRSRREIRFEGDQERWRIPAAAITHCHFEEFVHQQGEGRTRIFYTVLRVNHRGGFWEAPIRPRGGLGFFSKKRKRATLKLFESICNICGMDKTAGSLRG